MKKFSLVFVFIAMVFIQKSFSQDSTSTLLIKSYFKIKDALVTGNAQSAAADAADFITAVNNPGTAVLSTKNRTSLLKDAASIADSKNLSTQRESFALLSASMFTVAKTAKLSGSPVYQQYCPMKNAGWLSDSKTIRNPYLGEAMLSCGSIKQTF